MKIDLSGVKVGDRVFHQVYGYGSVYEITTSTYRSSLLGLFRPKPYIRFVGFLCEGREVSFTLDGRGFNRYNGDHALVFHNAKECAEYFKWVAENE